MEGREVDYMYLNYIINRNYSNMYTQHNKVSLRLPNKEFTWQSHMRFDVHFNDTLDIQVCGHATFSSVIDSYKKFIY